MYVYIDAIPEKGERKTQIKYTRKSTRNCSRISMLYFYHLFYFIYLFLDSASLFCWFKNYFCFLFRFACTANTGTHTHTYTDSPMMQFQRHLFRWKFFRMNVLILCFFIIIRKYTGTNSAKQTRSRNKNHWTDKETVR